MAFIAEKLILNMILIICIRVSFYAGFGYKHADKQFSELTYGNMPTITDEVKRTDLANTYSLSDGLLDSAARRATQYTYTSEYENGDK